MSAKIKKGLHDLKSKITGDGTLDKDYDQKNTLITKHFKNLKKLHKSLKLYEEAVIAIGKAEASLAKHLKKVMSDDSCAYIVQNSGAAVTIENSAKFTGDCFKGDCASALEKYLAQFVELEKRMKERNTRMYEMERLEKEAKHINTTTLTQGQDVASALEASKNAHLTMKNRFETLNEELKKDIPLLYADRYAFLDVFFPLVTNVKMKFFQTAADSTNSLYKPVDIEKVRNYPMVLTQNTVSAMYGGAYRNALADPVANPSSPQQPPALPSASHRSQPPLPNAPHRPAPAQPSDPGSTQPPALPSASHRSQPPLPSAPHRPQSGQQPPLPSAPHRSFNPNDLAADAIEGVVTNSAVQQQVGLAVASQANDRDTQAKLGSTIASNSDNTVVKAVASNSTAQKLTGKVVGVAATNKTVQRAVGQAIADKARSELAANPIPNPLPSLPTPAVRGRQARALFDFNTTDPTELPFRKGDIILITDQPGEWWKGEFNGRVGDLPSNYVELL